jgi:hypothetical protein
MSPQEMHDYVQSQARGINQQLEESGRTKQDYIRAYVEVQSLRTWFAMMVLSLDPSFGLTVVSEHQMSYDEIIQREA